MTKNKQLSAVIIGCGRIAGGAAATARDVEPSHAGAYLRHPGYRLAACIEPDEERRSVFMHRWDIADGFTDLDAWLASQSGADVASVCTPTAQHTDILGQLLDSPVRAVICEKPLTPSAAKSAGLVEAYRQVGKPLAIAYLRRWNPALRELQAEISSGAWGKLRAVTGSYTKGVLHNGSHLIDLIQFLAGQLALTAVTAQRSSGDRDDPTLDAVLKLADGTPVHLIGTEAEDYALFELHLFTELGAICLEQSGRTIRRRRRVKDLLHPGYRLLEHGDWSESGSGDPFVRVLDNVAAALESGDPLLSDGQNALAAQRLCEEMIEAAKSLNQ